MDWLKLVMMYGGAVFQTVTAVEASVHAPGATKRKIALDIITLGANVAQRIPEAHVQQIGTLIDVIVTALNKSGVFVKGAIAPPAVPLVPAVAPI
jgi:hypothetical protein